MKLIAFSGYARSGKDTAAEALIEEGFERIAFADALRNVLYALNPQLGSVSFGQGTSVENYRLQDFIDKFGWNGYKEVDAYYQPLSLEVRRLLQRLGTEAGREVLGENIWVDTALKDLNPDGKYVITDCRFPNEAKAVFLHGGLVVRINRPGITAVNAHPSETSLDEWPLDDVINNDKTIWHLKRLVKRRYVYA